MFWCNKMNVSVAKAQQILIVHLLFHGLGDAANADKCPLVLHWALSPAPVLPVWPVLSCVISSCHKAQFTWATSPSVVLLNTLFPSLLRLYSLRFPHLPLRPVLLILRPLCPHQCSWGPSHGGHLLSRSTLPQVVWPRLRASPTCLPILPQLSQHKLSPEVTTYFY